MDAIVALLAVLAEVVQAEVVQEASALLVVIVIAPQHMDVGEVAVATMTTVVRVATVVEEVAMEVPVPLLKLSTSLATDQVPTGALIAAAS